MADEVITPVGGMEAFLSNQPEVGQTEQPTEPTPAEGSPEAAPVIPPQEGAGESKFFEEINKRFSREYKSDEELQEVFASTARIADYDTKIKEATEYKQKAEELTNAQKAWLEEKAKLEAKVNPLAFFRDEKAFVAEQLRRQFPDRDPMAIERLVTTDLSRMDKVELLAQKMLLDTPDIDGGLDGAKEAVLAQMGVEQGSKPEEWDRITKNRLTVEAGKARKELEEFQRSIEIPKVKTEDDVKAEIAAHQDGLRKAWTPFLDKMEAIDKLQIPSEDGTVLATIDIPEQLRKEMRSELIDDIIASGVEPTEDAIRHFNAIREQRFIHKNLPKLYKILENQWLSKSIEERDRLLNNTQPPNNAVKPDVKPDDTGMGMRSFLDTY